MKMGKSMHTVQVGCDCCGSLHLTKDCDLYENGNTKTQACFQVGIDMTKNGVSPRSNGIHLMNTWTKKKKNKGKKDVCSIKKSNPRMKKSKFETMLAWFVTAFEKRHDAKDAIVRNQQASMHTSNNKLGNSWGYLTSVYWAHFQETWTQIQKHISRSWQQGVIRLLRLWFPYLTINRMRCRHRQKKKKIGALQCYMIMKYGKYM